MVCLLKNDPTSLPKRHYKLQKSGWIGKPSVNSASSNSNFWTVKNWIPRYLARGRVGGLLFTEYSDYDIVVLTQLTGFWPDKVECRHKFSEEGLVSPDVGRQAFHWRYERTFVNNFYCYHDRTPSNISIKYCNKLILECQESRNLSWICRLDKTRSQSELTMTRMKLWEIKVEVRTNW